MLRENFFFFPHGDTCSSSRNPAVLDVHVDRLRVFFAFEGEKSRAKVELTLKFPSLKEVVARRYKTYTATRIVLAAGGWAIDLRDAPGQDLPAIFHEHYSIDSVTWVDGDSYLLFSVLKPF